MFAGEFRKQSGLFKMLEACTTAAGLMLLGLFVAHVEVSVVLVGVFYLCSVAAVLAARDMSRSLMQHVDSRSHIAAPLAGPRGSNIEGMNYVIKRAFDIIGASILMVFCLPIMLVAALAILIFDGREVLYRQKRIGAQGRPFEMLKLRTMKSQTADLVHREYVQEWIRNEASPGANGNGGSGKDQKVFKLCDDPRITKVGKLLRRFSIDELPQLWNVLRGDMSLIGPRPALPYELELYQDWHRRRLEGLPGITGLWQVSGRNRVSFEDMVRLDVKYLEDWSLSSDIRILLHTIPVLLRGEGL